MRTRLIKFVQWLERATGRAMVALVVVIVMITLAGIVRDAMQPQPKPTHGAEALAQAVATTMRKPLLGREGGTATK